MSSPSPSPSPSPRPKGGVSVSVSGQDKKDLDKFTKFLGLKVSQVIVQSRLGEKLHTHCKLLPQATGADWFSLAINDLPGVLTETKKALYADNIGPRLPLCVEISLRTVEGDTMILETWTLGSSPDQCDPSVKVTCAIYNRMGKLLKSLISVTRATPAYKLSRRQCADSYVIYYRIYNGEPQYHNLGDGYKQIKIGQICTPTGTLYMSVAYRTKMTITPMQIQQETSIMVKSDHFHADLSPKHLRCKQNQSERKKVDLDKPMRPGAFVDVSKVRQYTESDFILPEQPAFSWLLGDANNKMVDSSEKIKEKENGDIKTPNKTNHDENLDSSFNYKHMSNTSGQKAAVWTDSFDDDDKLMEELHFPFAIADKCPTGELAGFYRECYHAPALQTFTTPFEEPSSDISKQLEVFETSLQEYDQMMTSLCHSPNNN